MSKRILITGATSGIGEATAKYLFSLEYRLVLVGRNEEKLAELKNSMGEAAEVVAADLCDDSSVKRLFDFCHDNGLMLDGLVHCAGIAGDKPIRLCTIEYLEKLMHIHYFAFVELCKYFAKKTYSNDGASIVAVSSVSNILRKKASAPYACAKSAVDTAVSVMSKEFTNRGIRVNTVKPALTDTPFLDLSRDTYNIFDYQPFGYIPPEHIAYMIEYLLSDKAKYITDAHIPISGGMEL